MFSHKSRACVSFNNQNKGRIETESSVDKALALHVPSLGSNPDILIKSPVPF